MGAPVWVTAEIEGLGTVAVDLPVAGGAVEVGWVWVVAEVEGHGTVAVELLVAGSVVEVR